MANKPNQRTEEPFNQSWRLPLVRLLLGFALAVSGYLLFVSLTSGAAAGCGPDSACDRVLKSRWAYWLGIPVSLPALLIYAGFLGSTFALTRKSPVTKRLAWRLMFTAALLILGAAVWFIALMLISVKGVCPFCLAAHAAGLFAAIVVLCNAPIRPIPELSWQIEKQVYVPPDMARRLAMFAGVALLGLAGGQLLHKKQLNIVKTLPAMTNAAPAPANLQTGGIYRLLSSTTIPAPKTNPVAVLPPLANTVPPPPTTNPTVQKGPLRVITTHSGHFQYNLSELPLLGPLDAANVIVSLFDYTCHHCHIMHGHLQEALRQFSNSLAVVSLPMPLDAECNPLVTRTPRVATNACNYARLGLAVWRADRTRFPQFEEFMWARPTPPPIMEATTHAANLVGADNLARALADKWVSDRLQMDVSIYHTNVLMLGNGSMPQLIIGQKVSAGSLTDAEALVKLLRENLPKR